MKEKQGRKCVGSKRTVLGQGQSGANAGIFQEKVSMATDVKVRGIKGKCSFRGSGWPSTAVILLVG